jgi:hypothetical protein
MPRSIICFSLFPTHHLFFVTRASILTWDIFGNPLFSEQTTIHVVMKIAVLFLIEVFYKLKTDYKEHSTEPFLSGFLSFLFVFLFLILFTQCSATP